MLKQSMLMKPWSTRHLSFRGGMVMKKIDARIAEIKKLQTEIDHRTKVEQEAEKLICQCRFEEAMKLLATLD